MSFPVTINETLERLLVFIIGYPLNQLLWTL